MNRTILICAVCISLIAGCTDSGSFDSDPASNEPFETPQQQETLSPSGEMQAQQDDQSQPQESGTSMEAPETEKYAISIFPRKRLMTHEDGTVASFAVSLSKAPSSNVTVVLYGSPSAEGRVMLDKLVFTPDNWKISQYVGVMGVDDDLMDGNQIFTVSFEVMTDDPDYRDLTIDPVEIVNVDNDIDKGFVAPNTLHYLRPDLGLETDDYGSRTYLEFGLSNRPAYDVIVELESSDPSVAVPERSRFVIAPDEWGDVVEIPVIGVDDNAQKGDRPFTINIVSVQSDDPSIDSHAVDYNINAYSNEIAGITYDRKDHEKGVVIKNISNKDDKHLLVHGTVSEDGDYVEFSAHLESKPLSEKKVTVAGIVTDHNEGRIEPDSLTFSDKDWDQPKTFRVYGVDDQVIDGDIFFGVKLVTYSDDLSKNEIAGDMLVFLNRDNDGVLEEPLEPALVVRKAHDVLYTGEDGMSKAIHLKLNRQPSENVRVYFSSSDLSEGKVVTNMVSNINYDDKRPYIEFSPFDWNVEQELMIQGQDDLDIDGNVDYHLSFVTESDDPAFNHIATPVVNFINFDNDEAAATPAVDNSIENNNYYLNTDLILVSGVDPNNTNIVSGEKIFWLSLAKKPKDDVSIQLTTTNIQYAGLNYSDYDKPTNSVTYQFTPDNYDQKQAVKLILRDNIPNNAQFVIRIKSPVSADPLYDALSRIQIPFEYIESAGTEIPVEPSPVNNIQSDEPRLVFEPNICNSVGAVQYDGKSQIYKVHLAKQPKNNVKVTFSIPDEYKDWIQFKNNKYNLTFKPSNYDVDQTIEIVPLKQQTDSEKLISLAYTMTSADENYEGDDPNGCTAMMYYLNNDSTQQQTPRTRKLRIMAANTTSGKDQRYEDPGMNMFYAMDPDIILIQEFAPSAKNVVQLLKEHFGVEYHYYAGKGHIGNGIITKGDIKIKKTFSQASAVPQITNRQYDAAVIDIPGNKDLLAVSLHLYTKTDSEGYSQKDEYPAVAEFIRSILNQGDYYIAVGGDFNTTSNYQVNRNWNSLLATNVSYPRDQNGNFKTNANRKQHYDWLLVDSKLQDLAIPVSIGSKEFPYGYVLDSRVHTPLSDISPVRYNDSKASHMQHMPVVRDFLIEY